MLNHTRKRQKSSISTKTKAHRQQPQNKDVTNSFLPVKPHFSKSNTKAAFLTLVDDQKPQNPCRREPDRTLLESVQWMNHSVLILLMIITVVSLTTQNRQKETRAKTDIIKPVNHSTTRFGEHSTPSCCFPTLLLIASISYMISTNQKRAETTATETINNG